MTTALPPRGWHTDPDNAEGKRYWSGTEWTEKRRTPCPVWVITSALFCFTVLGIYSGYTAWPANGASCETTSLTVAPFWVFLTLWALGIGLAIALAVIWTRHWFPSPWPWLCIAGTFVLPILVSMVGHQSCYA
ncbi:MAG: DUF2510 domain-containing protein [Actinobacteria bacterium]|nr:DUF2510 domain-containing protein [Actinomycetota bacterium]